MDGEFLFIDSHRAGAADDVNDLVMIQMIVGGDEGFGREQVYRAVFVFRKKVGGDIRVFFLQPRHKIWDVAPLPIRGWAGGFLPYGKESEEGNTQKPHFPVSAPGLFP